MAAQRNNIQDFMRDIRAKTGVNTYQASLNADNVTVTVTKNQVVLFSKVLWNASGAGVGPTDIGGVGNGDTVGISDGSGFYSFGSAQAFINNLV